MYAATADKIWGSGTTGPSVGDGPDSGSILASLCEVSRFRSDVAVFDSDLTFTVGSRTTSGVALLNSCFSLVT